jgi:hypothetical protein
MSALGHKQTFRNANVMSALPPKADMGRLLFMCRPSHLQIYSERFEWAAAPVLRGLHALLIFLRPKDVDARCQSYEPYEYQRGNELRIHC